MKNEQLSEELIRKIIGLFPETRLTPQGLEASYPPRALPVGGMVTRIAPSPTGFVHLGTLYTAMISERLAHQSGGVFFLRIEDTDTKREIPGATTGIIDALAKYGIDPDEGILATGEDRGAYGPYKQSARAAIYRTYLFDLLARGMAYFCFCSSQDLAMKRTEQERIKTRTGYYGAWATCRHLSAEDAAERIAAGKPFTIRFRSPGSFERKTTIHDLLIQGIRELPENDQDIVLLKSDGLPTYHFAHVVDDHLMRTTHVIRGDEWFSSVPLHLQLFAAMGWAPPQYGHLAPIQKLQDGRKRKLSKRKDPEAALAYFEEQGYPREGLVEYLLNLANSNFEDWRKEHPTEDVHEFKVTREKLARTAGALFDGSKLADVCKEVISRFSAEKVYDLTLAWANEYDKALAALLSKDVEYTQRIFNIERGATDGKGRKDLVKWSDVRAEIGCFYDEAFTLDAETATELLSGIDPLEAQAILNAFLADYQPTDDKDAWFGKMRALSVKLGYADSTRTLKLEPNKYKGSVSDVTKVIRVFLTGKTQTPDLFQVLQVMGPKRVNARLRKGA